MGEGPLRGPGFRIFAILGVAVRVAGVTPARDRGQSSGRSRWV